jgi:thiosulfate dehydrogenase
MSKSKKWFLSVVFLGIIFGIWWVAAEKGERQKHTRSIPIGAGANDLLKWRPPDSSMIPNTPKGELIRYGKKLIAFTGRYFGPKGSVASISNGMNCQNCHLDAGTRLFGNNYSAVFSTYPKFRDRSGTVENIYKRINDCLQRSLNGRALDTNSLEMKAMAAYINWLGQNVPKDIKPEGAGISDIKFMDRAADTNKGHALYLLKCERCHGNAGEGLKKADGTDYTYPPLWGVHSYTTAAGLFRISRFAGYIKDNMPFGSTHELPQISDEEAWNLAGFVNSQPRPDRTFASDWPNKSKKPLDYPFGPYADSFSERQHKYGPFRPIQLVQQQNRSRN